MVDVFEMLREGSLPEQAFYSTGNLLGYPPLHARGYYWKHGTFFSTVVSDIKYYQGPGEKGQGKNEIGSIQH